jgi:hypothetical protein
MEEEIMKRALRAILIQGGGMKFDVLVNRKKITIREGHRDYTNGPVLIGCPDLNWSTMRDIINVRHCRLVDVTEEEFKADGYDSKADMLMDLSKYYPDINWDSEVTVIKWQEEF